jgi:hypothetical protein
MEFMPNKFFDLEEIKDEIAKTEIPHIEGIIVDENHQLSENAKFGIELAKNPSEWNRFFGI